MTIDYQRLRVEGVYKQDEDGHLMLRIKVPAGVLSVEQALKVCEIAERFGNGRLHLTTRGSIELHWLQYGDLAQARRMLAGVGLTTRGACGGAVRGVSCSTTLAEGFAVSQVLAAKLHRHFAGNPHFEGLPKKFKIGVDAGYAGSRHLIQDLGLVFTGTEEGIDLYDVWTAGGLGREPQEAFLLEERVPERRLIPLIEAVVRVYKRYTPKGKRLKHLVREIGEKKFRRQLEEALPEEAEVELFDGFEKRLTALAHGPALRREVPVFAGELETQKLRQLSDTARRYSDGFLALTADQNLVFFLGDEGSAEGLDSELAALGGAGDEHRVQVRFRICPGSHECKMGLARTREVAEEVIAAMGPEAHSACWAISGCANSCAQPQLADYGIIAARLVKEPEGERRPLFDLYRRKGEGFGTPLRRGVTFSELLEEVAALG